MLVLVRTPKPSEGFGDPASISHLEVLGYRLPVIIRFLTAPGLIMG